MRTFIGSLALVSTATSFLFVALFAYRWPAETDITMGWAIAGLLFLIVSSITLRRGQAKRNRLLVIGMAFLGGTIGLALSIYFLNLYLGSAGDGAQIHLKLFDYHYQSEIGVHEELVEKMLLIGSSITFAVVLTTSILGAITGSMISQWICCFATVRTKPIAVEKV